MKTYRLAITLVAGLVSQQATAGVRPAAGDLYYNGQYFADSFFYWTSPGPFSGYLPGYEHDMRLGVGLFGACTTFTNLPNGYDDCPTAGWSEPLGYIIFSFGSYHANNIQANYGYYGGWNLSQPLGQIYTEIDLFAQNVQHRFCPIDYPWCMQGVSGGTVDLLPYPLYMYFGGYPTIIYW